MKNNRMRKDIQELYSLFCNQEVFIVGGGYSVQNINVDYLSDKRVIVINDSFKLLPNANAIFWCDSSWAGKNLEELESHSSHLRFHPRFYSETHIREDIKGPGNANLLMRTGDHGFDTNIDNVRGNNGGVQCLNFVLNMNPSKVYLVGYDMRDNPRKRGETHWHNYHSLVVRPDIYANEFIPSMNSLYREIQRLGITTEIINCSATSALTCFPKKNIAGLMR